MLHGKRAQIVDAMGVVGVLVRVQHAVEPIDLGIDELLAQIGRGVDQHAGAPVRAGPLDQERAAPPPVFRIVGIAEAPAERRARNPSGRATAENGEGEGHPLAIAGRGAFANRRKKFSVVSRAIVSSDAPRVSASTRAVSTTKAGSLRLPRRELGAR